MKYLTRLWRSKRGERHSVAETEARFMRLYSLWHETRDIGLQRRLCLRIAVLTRRSPNLNIRRWFQHAF